jgi:hypothetical protein
MPPNVYDKASRYAAKADPAGFFAWLLGLPAEAFAFRGWLDTRGIPFPGDPDRTGDTVARLDDPAEHGRPWVVAVEFQVRPDPDMFGRVMGYLSGLWLGLRPDDERGSRYHLGAAVVNLTGSGSVSRGMRWPAAGLTTHLGIGERNLEREPAEELLAGIESGRWSRCLLPWVSLMAGADQPGTVDRWKAAAGAEPNSRRKAEFGGIALIFADRAGRKALWAEKLEGWNVEESTVVQEWIALGEARGEARGRNEGRVEGAREFVVRLGTKRFGGPPSSAQRAALDAATDLDRLTQLGERVYEVNSWDELLPPAS